MNKSGSGQSCSCSWPWRLIQSVKHESNTVSLFLPEKVSTQADHRILGCVQTNVTLERAVLAVVVSRSRAARSGTRVFGGRSRARGWRGSGGGHLRDRSTHPKKKGGVQVGVTPLAPNSSRYANKRGPTRRNEIDSLKKNGKRAS